MGHKVKVILLPLMFFILTFKKHGFNNVNGLTMLTAAIFIVGEMSGTGNFLFLFNF